MIFSEVSGNHNRLHATNSVKNSIPNMYRFTLNICYMHPISHIQSVGEALALHAGELGSIAGPTKVSR